MPGLVDLIAFYIVGASFVRVLAFRPNFVWLPVLVALFATAPIEPNPDYWLRLF